MLFRTLILLVLVLPGIGQNEEQPYFSLTSTSTFGSNGKPRISMSAWNVDTLEFRVYRINDPLKFFRQLEDPHQFGGAVPKPAHAPTLLERVHGWKHSLRTSIRRGLRAQFTEAPSAHFESILPRGSTPQPASKGTQYAEVPVLNSEQLVLTFAQPVTTQTRWASQSIEVPVKKKGVYLVEAVRKDLCAYTILMVSDIITITKTSHGRIITFAADRASGEPVPGAAVYAITRDGPPVAAVETDADGIAEISAPEKTDDVRVVARKGADFAINALSSYAFGTERDRWVGYLYTDRPVYRPGHTVHFKGILRLRAPVGYEIPAAKVLNVKINDPDQKAVYQRTLTTNADGVIHDEFTLGPAAALGSYSIEIQAGESYMNGGFEVQEYKKPEYEVRVTPSKPRVLEGETVQATVEARYYFGEPVAAAKVKYAVYRSRYWFPLWYEPEDDSSDAAQAGGDDTFSENEQVADGEGQLDADGKLTISFPTTESDHKFDNRYRIEARVTDESRREIAGSGWVVATYGSFLVNATPDRYFYEQNARASIKVEARDYDSNPVQTQVHVELVRWSFRKKEIAEVITSTDVKTGADGSATTELVTPQRGGSYHVRVTAHTPEGRDVEQSAWLWVAGKGEADWFGPGQKTVQIVPDKKSYRPGDTAKLLIVTGKADTPVLVSIEGREVRSRQLIRSRDATAEFQVPITVNDEPALFVTAHFVRNGELYQSTKRVKVPPQEHKLNVKLTTDKPQYLPGQTATYNVDVTASDGRPVARADLSLGVVDEAIYAIRPDTTPDIVNFFFGREWNSVYTDSSLSYYFSGEAGKRRMRLAMLRPMSKLAELKPERLVEPKVRKAFPDTALWAADITTDANGHAKADVEFPDSLTTWRATARGITVDNKVGSATLKTIVRKNVILRLAVPRFFVQGDEVVISTLIHNYLTTDKTAHVSLNVKGLDLLDGKPADVTVPSRGEARVDWRVRAKTVRNATITGKALTDEESDALELELPVNPPGVKLALSKGGSLGGSNAAAFSLTYPQQVEPGSRSLAIHVAPSIAGSLFGALEYLTSYPYGCVEQTMSSFLPNIIVEKTIRDLGLKQNIDEAALQQKIRAGLDRLYSFQHEDGGWGWWETDETHPFMTAYVVAGLAQARDAGTQVTQEAIDKGVGWLQKADNSGFYPDLRAYIAYALSAAAQPDKALLDQVYDQRSKLSPYGLALLGLALESAKDTRTGQVASALEQNAKQDQEQAWWPATRDEMLDFSADVTPEATAYAVKFLSHQRHDSPLLPKAALWLMNHRDEGYWWSSTKQTAMVIYGLADFLKATNELNPNLTATIYVNDQPVLTKQFDKTSAALESNLVLDESKLQPGENRIRVTTSGDGRLYYSARAEYFSTEQKLQKTGTVSLNLLRDYFRLVPTKKGDRTVYDLADLPATVSSGDVIAVRLTVTGTEWRYLIVEDPIPAGTEFIQNDHLYELNSRPPWWQYWFTRREMHDDRMAIFQRWFREGQQQYFYLLKVVNPGVFKVSPARVQPMYQPAFLATSESRRLEVK